MREHQEGLLRFQKDIDYFESHWQELLQTYPDAWVAVFGERVVGADPDLERLLDTLEQRGIPIAKALVRHLTVSEDDLILLSR